MEKLIIDTKTFEKLQRRINSQQIIAFSRNKIQL